MTRILISLIAAASFILPAAALAEPSAACIQAFENGDPVAIGICEQMELVKQDIAHIEADLMHAEAEASILWDENRDIRIQLHEAKINYADNPTADNFWAIIGLQKDLNANRPQLEDAMSLVDDLVAAINLAYAELDALEQSLQSSPVAP